MEELRESPRGGDGAARPTARQRLVRVACTTVCSLAVLGGAAGAANACTETWTGNAGTDDWGTAANWSPAAPPGAGNGQGCDVVIPSGATVDLRNWAYDYGTTIGNPVTQNTIGSLSIANGATLVVHGVSSENPPGDGNQTIELDVDGAGTIAQGGTLELLASDDGENPTPENGHGGNAVLGGTGTVTNDGTLTSVSTTTQATASSNAFHNVLGVNFVNAADGNVSVASGYLNAQGDITATNQGTWTVASGASEQVVHYGDTGADTDFVNQGSYVNDGTTTVGNVNWPIIWTQSGGSVTGNTIVMGQDSQLADSAGTGAFLFNNQSGQISGTIPAGQTVTVEGDSYGNGYQLKMTLAGSQVINQGTLVFNAPDVSQDLYDDTETMGSPLVNQGTLDFSDAAPKLIHQIDVSVTNQPGATIDVGSGTVWFTGGATDANDGTLTVAPGANLDINANPFLTGSTTFTNGGTIVPQISRAATGTVTFDHNTNINLGGNVVPQLVGGYAPAAGTEVQAFPVSGATIAGQFGGVGGGWAADYTHETGNAPNYIGLVYQPQPAVTPTAGPPTRASAVKIAKPKVHGTMVAVKLTCAKAGTGCKKTTITETVAEKVRGKKGKARTKQVVVGTSSATLKAGTSKTVTVKLNKAGKALLAKAHHLKVTLKVAVGGKAKKRSTLTLSQTKAKTKKAPGKHRSKKHRS